LATSPTQTGTFDRVAFDLDGNSANAEILLSFGGTSWFFAWASTGRGYTLALNSSVTTAGLGYPLAQGFTSTAAIASHLTWGPATSRGAVFRGPGGTGTGTWMGSSGYLGYRAPDGGGGHTYGWIQIEVNDPLSRVTILNWSAAAAGGGSAGGGAGGASGTPEPAAAGLGLLALGAAGVLRHKWRRKGKAA